MEILFFGIVASPVFAFVYVYLKASIHVHRKHWHEAYPQFEPRSHGGLPPHVCQTFARDVPRYEALGFAVVGYFYRRALRRDESMELDLYMVLLRNDETGDFAQLLEIFAKGKKVSTSVGVRGFTAEFADGDALSTIATRQVMTFRPDPRNRIFRFPNVDDPRLLFRAHRKLLERHAPGRAAVLPSRGMEVAHLSHTETKVLRRQAEFGYFDFDEEADAFRPTWKGALVMTARQMWLIHDLLRAGERAAADVMLKSLDLRA